MSTPKKSFWSTVPGLVTGLVGLLTTLVALGTLLVTLGVIGDKSSTTVTTLAPGGTPGATTGGGGSGGATPTTAGTALFDASPRNVSLTAASKSATVTVTNRGTAKLTMETPAIDGPQKDQFQVVATACTKTDIPVGDTCSMTVTFKGGLEATATMTLSADKAKPVDVALKGTLL